MVRTIDPISRARPCVAQVANLAPAKALTAGGNARAARPSPPSSGMLHFDDGVDPAAHEEVALDGHAPGREQRDEIVEDLVRDGFVERAFVAEAPQVELQA